MAGPSGMNKKQKDLLIDAFFRQEHQNLYRYVYQLVANAADSGEIVQEAFLAFYRLQCAEEACKCDRALLFRIAKNLAIDLLRRSRTRDTYQREAQEGKIVVLGPKPPRTPEEILLEEERQSCVRLALEQLSKKEQDCLALRRWGLSYQEVAETLNLNSQSVGQTITRALRKFRGVYAEILDKKEPAGKACFARRR